MGKCNLHSRRAIEYLSPLLGGLNKTNFKESLVLGAAQYSDGLETLLENSKDVEFKEDIDKFIVDTVNHIINDDDLYWAITDTSLVPYLTELVEERSLRDEFIVEFINSVAVKSNMSKTVQPETVTDGKISMSDALAEASRTLSETNGKDSEEGTGEYANPEFQDMATGNSNVDFFLENIPRKGSWDLVSISLDRRAPLNAKVDSDNVFFREHFADGLTEYYNSEFIPFIHNIIGAEYLNHIKTLHTSDVDGQAIIESALEKFLEIGNATDIDFNAIREGNHTLAERESYYAHVAFTKIETILYNHIKYIIANKKGRFIINSANIRGRQGFVDNGGKVEGYQITDETNGMLLSTQKLSYIGIDKDTGLPLYDIGDTNAYITKNDIIALGQFLQRHITNNIVAKGKSVTEESVLADFRNPPTKNSSQDYKVMHSLIQRFFNSESGGYLTRNIYGRITKHSSFSADTANSVTASKIVGRLTNSISSLLTSMGINSKITLANGRPDLKDGSKNDNLYFLSADLNEALINPQAPGGYAISHKTLKVIRLGDDSPYKYKIQLKLSKNSVIEFLYEGSLSNSRFGAGIKVAQSTLDDLGTAFGKGRIITDNDNEQKISKQLLVKVIERLQLPSELQGFKFMNKYVSNTVGMSTEMQFEHAIANIVFQLAMNIPANERVIRLIDKDILPSEEDIENIYSYTTKEQDVTVDEGLTMHQTLKFSPFKSLININHMFDTALVDLNGRASSSMIKELGEGGYEYGTTSLSVAQETPKTVARAKANNLPHGNLPANMSIADDIPVSVLGSRRDGNIVKPVIKFTSNELLDAYMNGGFMASIIKYKGKRMSAPIGATPDSKRIHFLTMNLENNTKPLSLKTSPDRKAAVNDLIDYEISYYSGLKKITLSNWANYLDGKFPPAVISKAVVSLTSLNEFIIQNNIKYADVRKVLADELDYVKYGDTNIAIKPEYIEIADNTYAVGTRAEAKSTLDKGYKRFLRSPEYKAFKISHSNRSFMLNYFSREKLSYGAAKEILGFAYYWKGMAIRNVFQRANAGDILSYKGSINRGTVENDATNIMARSKSDKNKITTAQEAQVFLEKKRVKQGWEQMMNAHSKRLSLSFTYSARINKKDSTDKGNYLQNYDLASETGGINIMVFDAITPDDNLRNAIDNGRDALGARDKAGIDDLLDGWEGGHPLFFKQYTNGVMDAHGQVKGSAMKPSISENNGYQVRGTKSSIQDIFTYDNLSKSAQLRDLFKKMNSKISFNKDGSPLLLNLPAVEYTSKGTKITDIDTLLPTPIRNMNDLYNHFGAEQGHLIYQKLDSWSFIGDYILSGFLNTGSDQIATVHTNKYVGVVSTTSAKKMGNRKINPPANFKMETSIDDLIVDVLDPFNMGSILNSHEDIDSTEGEDGSEIKLMVQVMRSIKLGGNNLLEAEIAHQSKALLTDIGYKNLITQRVQDEALTQLLSQANLDADDTNLVISPESHFKVNVLLRGETASEIYDTLEEIRQKERDVLDPLAAQIIGHNIVKKSLKHLNEDQDILTAFDDGHLNLHSTQITDVLVSNFNAEVSKATINQKLKGSHTVVGPVHGMIKLFEIEETGETLTFDDYTKSFNGIYRSIQGKESEYRPHLSMSTQYKYTPMGSTTSESGVIGDKVFEIYNKNRAQNDIYTTITEVYESVIDEILSESEQYAFKVPDISRERDLQYATFYKKTIDPVTGDVTFIQNDQGGYESIYDTASYAEVVKIRDHKVDFQPIHEFRHFDDIVEADTYLEESFGMLPDETLFRVAEEIYVYDKGSKSLTPYHEVYGKTYTDAARYTQDELEASGIEISYQDYITNYDVKDDINDDIRVALVEYAKENAQQLLDGELHYADVIKSDGSSGVIQIIGIYDNAEDLATAGELAPGYYIQADELVAVGNVPAVTLTGEVESESLWEFQSTELIMKPNYSKLYFIGLNTSLADIFSEVDYSKVSRKRALHYYDIYTRTGDESWYIDGANEEFNGLYKKFHSELTKEIKLKTKDDKYIPSRVFLSAAIGNPTITIEEELQAVRRHLEDLPEYATELLQREEFLLKAIGRKQSMNIIRVRYASKLNTLTDAYIREGARNRALSFNSSNEVVFTRVPSQDKQSYSYGRIVSYSHRSSNTVLTPADLILISGADYDIDKLFNLVYDINARGERAFFGDEVLNEDGTPNMTKIYDSIDDKVAAYRLELDQQDFTIREYSKKIRSYRKGLMADTKSKAHNNLVRALMTIITDPKNFKQATTLIATDTLQKIAAVRAMEKSSKGKGVSSFNPFDLISDIYLQKEGNDGNGMIGVVASALKVYSMVYTAATKTTLMDNGIKQFAPHSVLDGYLQEDKEAILKVLSQTEPELHAQLTEGNDKGLHQMFIKPKGSSTIEVFTGQVTADVEKSSEGFIAKYDQIKEYKRKYNSGKTFESIDQEMLALETQFAELGLVNGLSIHRVNTRIETWELFSELLSAATDNAKLLLMSKLDLNMITMGLVNTMLTVGYDLNQAFKFINQSDIKRMINESIESAATDNPKTLRNLLNTKARKSKTYDKTKFIITAGTGTFSKSSKYYENNGKTRFSSSVEAGSNPAALTKSVINELASPFMQLNNILSIQDSLSIVQKGASITKGIYNDEFDSYKELAGLEYRIKKALVGKSIDDDASVIAATDQIEFSLYEFFTDESYRDKWIGLLAESGTQGYNFLEVLSQNADIFMYKTVQVKAQKFLNTMQGMTAATAAVGRVIKNTSIAHYFEDRTVYKSYKAIAEGLIVSDYFNSYTGDINPYTKVEVPGIDDKTFDLTNKDGIVEFLASTGAFYDNLRMRAASEDAADEAYYNNPFIGILGITSGATVDNEANHIKFLKSINIKQISDNSAKMHQIAKGYTQLDEADQRVIELQSLIIHGSAKSTRTFEKFMNFEHLAAYNRHKKNVLETEDKFQEILDRTAPAQLLLNSFGSLRQLSTEDYARSNYEDEFMEEGPILYKKYEKSKSQLVRMPKMDIKEGMNGIDAFYSTSTKLRYAAIANNEIISALGSTNGFFPIENVSGGAALGYNTMTGSHYNGIQLIIESGFSPFSVKYRQPGDTKLQDGYILGKRKGGGYVILNSEFEYERDASANITRDVLIQDNLNLEISGKYIGRKSVISNSMVAQVDTMSHAAINKANIGEILRMDSSLYKLTAAGAVTKVVSPVPVAGNIVKGDVVEVVHHYGAKILVKYGGQMKVTQDNGFSAQDVALYGKGEAAKKSYTTYTFEVVTAANALSLYEPSKLGRGFYDKVDLKSFKKLVGDRQAKGILWNKTLFAALSDIDNDKVVAPTERVVTTLKVNSSLNGTFSRELYGRFTSIAELLNKLEKDNVGIPTERGKRDVFLRKMFNAEYNPTMRQLLDGGNIPVNVYYMLPLNIKAIPYNTAINTLSNIDNLKVSLEFDLKVDIELDFGLANILESVKDTAIKRGQLSTVEYTGDANSSFDEVVDVVNIGIKSETNYITDEDLDAATDRVVSDGVFMHNDTVVVVKVSEVNPITYKYQREDESIDIDAHYGVDPNADIQNATLLMSLKKQIRKLGLQSDVPLIVYEASTENFGQYDFTTGEFIPVLSGIPDIGDSPILLGFKTVEKEDVNDIKVVENLIRQRAYVDNYVNNYTPISEVFDHDLIDLAEDYDTEMAEVAASNQADKGNTLAYDQMLGMNGVTFFRYAAEGEVEAPDGIQFIQDDNTIVINDRILPVKNSFGQFSESGSLEFKVKTYLADGAVLIEMLTESTIGAPAIAENFIIFPDEQVRVEKYGRFNGQGKRVNLRGSLVGPDGNQIRVSIDIAYKTSEEHVLRRNKNVDDRIAIRTLMDEAAEFYTEKVRAIYNSMIFEEPGIKQYITERGGPSKFFKSLQLFTDPRLISDYPRISDGIPSLLYQFQEIYSQYNEMKIDAYEQINEYEEKLSAKYRTKAIATFDKDITIPGSINPATEVVISFTDKYMRTTQAQQAVDSGLSTFKEFYGKRTFNKEDGVATGAYFINVFRSAINNITFIKGKGKRFGKAEITRVVDALTVLGNSTAESVYLDFPPLAETISSLSDITYADLADLVVIALDTMGKVPDNLKFSSELATYIRNNSGAVNITKVKMTEVITTTSNMGLVKKPVSLNYYSPGIARFKNGRTILEELNVRKGVDEGVADPYVRARPGSIIGQSHSITSSLTEIYKDWLREDPGHFMKILSKVKGRSVLVNDYNQPIQQLVDAMNSLGFNLEFALKTPINLTLDNISQNGVTHQLVPKTEFLNQGESTTQGQVYKTIIDGMTFMAEIVSDATVVQEIDEDGFSSINPQLLNTLGIDRDLAMSNIDMLEEYVIVKLFRDPSTDIKVGNLAEVEGTKWGDLAENAFEGTGKTLDPEIKETLNKGDFPLFFDVSTAFGRKGISSFKGQDYFNLLASATSDHIYAEGLKPGETTVSLIGTRLGGINHMYDYMNKSTKVYSENDIKKSFELYVKPILDNFIVANNLNIAVGSRPGMDHEIRAYMSTNSDYSIDERGIIAYRPSTTNLVDTDNYITISTPSLKFFSANNGTYRVNPLSGMLNTVVAVESSDTPAMEALTNLDVEGSGGKGKLTEFRFKGDFTKMANLHGISQFHDIFLEEYKRNVSGSAVQIDLKRNHSFIAQTIVGSITGNVNSDITDELQFYIDSVIDAEGNLILYNHSTSEYSIGHPALQAAVAKSKHAAIMLIRNNLRSKFNLKNIQRFVKSEIDLDIKTKGFRKLYAGNTISAQEFEAISGADTKMTNFELMLYDITTSIDKNIDLDLVPSQAFFYSKMQELGLQGFFSSQHNVMSSGVSRVYHIFDTASIQESEQVTHPKYDSNLTVETLGSNATEIELAARDLNIYNYIRYGQDKRFELDPSGIIDNRIDKDPEVITRQQLRSRVKHSILTSLYEELGLEVDPQVLWNIVKDRSMDQFLNTHISNEVAGSSLIKTLFIKHKWRGIAKFGEVGIGKLSETEIGGDIVTGIIIPSSKGKVFLTKNGDVYSMDLSSLNGGILDAIPDVGFTMADRVSMEGHARPTNPGHMFNSIVVDGKIINDQVTLVENTLTKELIAESTINGNYYTYSEVEGDWTKVDVGSDSSNDLFITAQTPANVGLMTTSVFANGKIFPVKGVTVDDNTVTSTDGWVFEYNPDTKKFNLQPKVGEVLKGRDIRQQKEKIEFSSPNGFSLNSKRVSTKVLTSVVNSLSQKLGIESEMLSSLEIADKYGGSFANSLGFTFDDKVIINRDKATLDTPLHEFGHFYFRHLRKSDTKIFNVLKGMALNSEFAEVIKKRYPELNESDLAEEILTSMLGVTNQHKVLEKASKGIISRFLNTIKSWFNGLFGVKNKEYSINLDDSLADVLNSIGTQLIYGPRSILNEMMLNEKNYLNRIMNKTMSEKEAVDVLKDRGFIVEIC